MKSLYKEDLSYTERASKLSNEVHNVVYPMFTKMIKEGYSVREVAHLFHWAINDMEIDAALAAKFKDDNVSKSK